MSAAIVAVLAFMIATAVWVACNPALLRSAAVGGWKVVLRWLRVYLGERTARWLPWEPEAADRAVWLTAAVGVVLVCGLAAGFAALSDSVLDGGGVVLVDWPVSAWLAVHREPVLTAVLGVLTRIGGPCGSAAAIGVVSSIACWCSRSRLPLALGAAALGGCGLAVLVVKLVVARPRPALPYRVVGAEGYSFPSAHATGIAVAAVVCAWMIGHWLTTSWALRVAVWTVALILMAGVGFSRVYLGVHYPTDVLGGWVLGVAWAVVAIAAVELWQARPPQVGPTRRVARSARRDRLRR